MILKTPKKYKFLGVTKTQGLHSPYILGDTTRPTYNICPSWIKIGSKTAEKNSAQTNRQTNRHYENNGHWSLGRQPIMYKRLPAGMSRTIWESLRECSPSVTDTCTPLVVCSSSQCVLVVRPHRGTTYTLFTQYNRLSNGLSNGLTTSCIVYTNIQPVVNWFDNMLYRVNGALT